MKLFRKSRKPRIIRDILITPPQENAKRHGLAIVTRSKNDGAYFSEWVTFHLAAGVQHFFIYLDGDFEKSKRNIETTVPAEVCTFIPWQFAGKDAKSGKSLHPQTLAYSHAILNFGADFRWMGFIDLDEFIVPKDHNSIENALSAAGSNPNMSLPWHMYGFNDHDTRPDGPVIENYTHRARNVLHSQIKYTNFKCIVDPCEVTRVGVHGFHTKALGDCSSNDVGTIVRNNERLTANFISSENLQLNHYYTRSKQELREKIARGSSIERDFRKHSDHVNALANEISQNTCYDPSAIEFIEKFSIRKTKG